MDEYDDYEDDSIASFSADDYYYDDGTGVATNLFYDDPSSFFESLLDCWTSVTGQFAPKSAALSLASLALGLLTFSSLPKHVLHGISVVLGVVLLNLFFEDDLPLWVVMTTVCFVSYYSFASLSFLSSGGTAGCIAVSLFGAAIAAEFSLDGVVWHRLRGPGLLSAMKVISLAIDGDKPDPLRFLGYLLCPGTVVFGPWISYSSYDALIESPKRFSTRWFFDISLALLVSFLFLFSSVCLFSFLPFILPDPIGLSPVAMLWFAAYKDAASFRFSHYFVSFAAKASLLALGGGLERISVDETETKSEGSSDGKINPSSSFSKNVSLDSIVDPTDVTHPSFVEFPRSLVEVVVHWNVPMHKWLKDYAFKPARASCGTSIAIMLTYGVSALLHGLNFQLAAVLFSLGFYSFVEHALRDRLARSFSACIAARACPPHCSHEHKADEWGVRLFNLLFSGIAIFHLAYLGVAFDNGDEQASGYSMAHVMDKWHRLGFASPMLAGITFLFYLLLLSR